MPSSSGVDEIVGGAADDYAINAWFVDRQEQYWFHPDLLEELSDASVDCANVRG